MVFDKRVIDPDTFHSDPYGYTQAEFEDVDLENIDILFNEDFVFKTDFSQKKVCFDDVTSGCFLSDQWGVLGIAGSGGVGEGGS